MFRRGNECLPATATRPPAGSLSSDPPIRRLIDGSAYRYPVDRAGSRRWPCRNRHAGRHLAPPKDDYYELYKILVDTIDQVERNYVKPIDRRELIEAAIKGVLDKLDPYSTYISPDESPASSTTVDNEFGGIGIQLASDVGQLTILSPLVGSPAYEAGLEAGDRIVEINGQSTEGLRIEEAVHRLKGEPGTQVTSGRRPRPARRTRSRSR